MWCGTDTKRLYDRNCKSNNLPYIIRNYGIKPSTKVIDQCKKSLKYYKENPIEYKNNNYGFRTPDDFNDTDEGNVFLGCSFTFGTGHHLENTWAYKVNQDIGGKFWNLSLPGCGMDESFRYLYEFKDYLKIKNIFHLAPSFQQTRYEFIVDGKPLRLNLVDRGKLEKHHSDILIDDKYQLLHFQKNYNAIKGLSQDLNCNYYLLSDEIDSYSDFDDEKSIIARDLIHPSTGYNNRIYKEFMKLTKEL
jgi:hypothetical protein